MIACIDNLKGFFQVGELSKQFLVMHIKKVAPSQLLDQVFQMLQQEGLDPTDYDIRVQSKLTKQEISCDPQFIRYLLVNTIRYNLEKAPQDPLTIELSEGYLDYQLPEPNQLVPALHIVLSNGPLPKKKDAYQPYNPPPLVMDINHVNILDNVRIVRAHYGYFAWEEEGYLSQTYLLPWNLQSVKPKIFNFAEEDLWELIKLDYPADQAFLKAVEKKKMPTARIEKALKVCKHYHNGQRRKSGEPFYQHPLAVATLLLDHTQDEEVIIAALLHDTLEDTPYNTYQMESMFGDRVAQLVREVTYLYSKRGRPKIKQDKNFFLRDLIQRGHQDSLLIKLADRFHNLQTIQAHPSPVKQKAIVQETLDLFIPAAQKQGWEVLAKALKEECMKNINT